MLTRAAPASGQWLVVSIGFSCFLLTLRFCKLLMDQRIRHKLEQQV